MADENISRSLIAALRVNGHDVLSVKESLRGGKDTEILARAQAEGRIVLTHDKDFGELAFRFGLPAECGVILLRPSGSNPASGDRHALQAIESRSDWAGHFSVVTEDRIRMRPFL